MGDQNVLRGLSLVQRGGIKERERKQGRRILEEQQESGVNGFSARG